VTALWDRGRPVYGMLGHAGRPAAAAARLAVYLGDVSAPAAADRRNVGDARSSVVDMLTTIRLNGPAVVLSARMTVVGLKVSPSPRWRRNDTPRPSARFGHFRWPYGHSEEWV